MLRISFLLQIVRKGLLLVMMCIACGGGATSLREGGACGRPGAVVMTGSRCNIAGTGSVDIAVEVVCVGRYRCRFISRRRRRRRAGVFCRRSAGVTRKHCKVVVVVRETAGKVHIAWS